MSDKPNRPGLRIILAVIIANLLASVLSTLYLIVYGSPGALIQHAIRLVCYIALFVFLYRGLPWARWVTFGFFVVSGVSGIVASVVLLFYLVDPMFIYSAGIVPVVNLVSAAILLFSRSVKEYFLE